MRSILPATSNAKGDWNLLKWTEEGNYPKSQSVYDALVNSFISTNTELGKQDFDIKFSGSTCCSLLVVGKKIYWANAGDSRCILIRIPNIKELKANYHK